MLKIIFLSSTLFFANVASADAINSSSSIKTPQQIELEIEQAQHDFDVAKKMFIPWYTGPLITGAANNVPPGYVDLQPYLYLTVNYAAFNGHRKSIHTPKTYIINPLFLVEAGITNWLDVTIYPSGFFKWEKDQYANSFGDFPIQFGFQIYKETPYIPSIRLILGEIFPSGKYQNLNPKKLGLDASGQGAYTTTVGLNLSKVLWWFKLHPISVRLATNYNVPNTRVPVHGFNAYGGGYHTNGKVKVGNFLNVDLGVEVSLTERWVFATDVAYTCSNKSTFTGRPGFASPGIIATNGEHSSDQLSLAPAIEYNVSDVAGFIGGVWFSVTGRNSANFASLVLSYTVVF